jgi:hypothetical protein
MDRPAIEKLFDACLLSDDEMNTYRAHWATGATPALQ